MNSEAKSPFAWPSAAAMPAFSPERLATAQADFLRAVTDAAQGHGFPAKDRRFAGDAWSANPMAAWAASMWQLSSNAMTGLVDAVEADDKTRARLKFATEQWLAATAPSNFLAFNAEAQRKALESDGVSLAMGVRQLVDDLQRGHVSMTDESAFEVGRNVATTEGAVVFENELFQLIEYKAATARVHERPYLVVPPCINKFYILDLQPENSLVKHLVDHGHRTFVVSWRNPDESLAQTTWDDYIERGAIRAIEVVREIGDVAQINALGFCVGGTILATALAVLAARAEGATAKSAKGRARKSTAESPLASVTLLTTFLDFSDTGVLDVFIDEDFVKLRESQLAAGGVLAGRELATTFSFLRPNELVWNYVVGNYLKGEAPPPFDLLYWNSDATNLPGPMFTWYLRNTYLENNLAKPGMTTVCGAPIDFGKLRLPTYVYGSREDHIVPVGGAYASTQILPGPTRFVMGASGHIAGVINPPAKNKRSYWTRDQLPPTQAEWLAGATEHAGSWWPDWMRWLGVHAGKLIPAPKTYGNRRYRAIEPAPGRYVKAKA